MILTQFWCYFVVENARMTKHLILTFILLLKTFVFSQFGGSKVFTFLGLPTGAHMSGIAGYPSAVQDQSIDFGIINPSLINAKFKGNYSLQQSIMPSGINMGSLCTSIGLKKGTILPYLRYVSFGEIEGYDNLGNATNTFTAFDFQAGASYAFDINPIFTLGIGAGVMGSYLETYSSYGLSSTFGIHYHHQNELLNATLFAKNIGGQFKGYTSGNAWNSIPLEVQGAVSLKLKHAPFRFTIIGHHLNQWKIGYIDPSIGPSIDGLTGDTIPAPSIGFGEQLLRHFAFQTELVTKGILHFRLGFDTQRRQELKLTQVPGLSGFSFGLGLNFRKFTIDYGIMIYSKAGISNNIGIRAKLSDWGKQSKRS